MLPLESMATRNGRGKWAEVGGPPSPSKPSTVPMPATVAIVYCCANAARPLARSSAKSFGDLFIETIFRRRSPGLPGCATGHTCRFQSAYRIHIRGTRRAVGWTPNATGVIRHDNNRASRYVREAHATLVDKYESLRPEVARADRFGTARVAGCAVPGARPG